MKVWNISEYDIMKTAETVGVRINNFRREGNAFAFTLRLTPDKKWQKISRNWHRERKTAAVCFHGHYHFMRELFRINENARIKTAYCDYRGLGSFLTQAEMLAYQNIGSMMYPVQFRESCNCAETGDDYIMDERMGGSVKQYEMRYSDILMCPHFILEPEHYRANGSCRCNDPREQTRLIREAGYSASDFPKAS